MEWYKNGSVDDLVVPIDQCELRSFPSQKRWKQWGLNTIDEADVSLDNSLAFGNCVVDEGDISCETLVDVDQIEMDCLVGDGDREEISGVRGGISESSNCWTSLLNYQDYQLDGFPWTNQTDENFLNSLLVDDFRAGDQFHTYGSPNSQGAYSTTNNLATDILLDSHDMGSYEQMDSATFPFAFDWDKEQSYASEYNLENLMFSATPQYNAPVENVPAPVCAGKTINENPLVEETVLQEFGSAVKKMSHRSRLCFRDAMYRLATNSEKQSSLTRGEHGGNILLEKPLRTTHPDQTLRFTEKNATEDITNTIDRTIADLLFNKPYQQADCHQDLSSAAIPHITYLQNQQQLTLQPSLIRER